MSDILTKISEAIIQGSVEEMVDLTEEAVDDGLAAQDILDKGLMAGMDYVGVEFKAGNMFVPEVLRSAKAMQTAMEILKPLLVKAGAKSTGKVMLGTVKGDLHDIGKNLVATMLEGGGFQIVDIGTDVSPDKLVDAVQAHQPQIVALSALLTTTLPSMKRMIDRLVQDGLRAGVKVMIGGAPVTQDFADEIGADGYSDNAAGAVNLARQLVGAAA